MKTRDIFNSHQGKLIHKWEHYFDIYDRHFSKYRDKEIVLLEIGVSQGGSIELWKKFFGKGLRYYGIDINPGCKQFEEENVSIFIGSQEDPVFLKNVVAQIPDIDILIDDGGHTMNQQIVSFEMLFTKIKIDGIYLCEDNHTSYWFDFGGGMKRKGTYIEYIKNLIDVMHLWYAGEKTRIPNHQLKDKIYSIHIYDSIVVIEKKIVNPPKDVKAGNYTVGYLPESPKSFIYNIKHFLFKVKNRLRSIKYQ